METTEPDSWKCPNCGVGDLWFIETVKGTSIYRCSYGYKLDEDGKLTSILGAGCGAGGPLDSFQWIRKPRAVA